MMLMFPFHAFFMMNLLFSTALILSAEPWLAIWAALEFNLISFIPLLMTTPSVNSTEAAIKYFIIQALASIMFLLSTVTLNFISSTFSSVLLTTAMMLKMGVAPFHQWVPNVVSAASWPNVFIMLSLQKLAPIFILAKIITLNVSSWVLLAAAVSSLIGGLGGLNQTQARALIAYSSIGHMGWVTAALSINYKLTIMYTIFYILNLLPLIILMTSLSSNSLKSSLNAMTLPPSSAALMFSLFLSLGGMPPFLGFLPKLMVMKSLILMGLFVPMMMLLAGSLMNLYYYFSFAVIFSFTSNAKLKYPTSYPRLIFLLWMSLPIFSLPIFMPLFYS